MSDDRVTKTMRIVNRYASAVALARAARSLEPTNETKRIRLAATIRDARDEVMAALVGLLKADDFKPLVATLVTLTPAQVEDLLADAESMARENADDR